jgi:hypothetical protein
MGVLVAVEVGVEVWVNVGVEVAVPVIVGVAVIVDVGAACTTVTGPWIVGGVRLLPQASGDKITAVKRTAPSIFFIVFPFPIRRLG